MTRPRTCSWMRLAFGLLLAGCGVEAPLEGERQEQIQGQPSVSQSESDYWQVWVRAQCLAVTTYHAQGYDACASSVGTFYSAAFCPATMDDLHACQSDQSRQAVLQCKDVAGLFDAVDARPLEYWQTQCAGFRPSGNRPPPVGSI